MTTTIGASTSFQLRIPELTETADIQVALKLIAYGQSADPINDADIEATSLAKYISLKSNIASPTFTGNVTLPTGTASVAPLKFVSGTNLTTPVAGSMEYDGKALSYTNSTNTGRGIIPASHYYAYYGNSSLLGSSLTSPFGFKQITLSPYTSYEFEGMYVFTFNDVADGTTAVSSYPIFKIQGTSTIANSKFDVVYWCATGASISAERTARTIYQTYAVGNTSIELENTTATTSARAGVVKWKGIMRNQQAGTGTLFASIMPSVAAANVSIKDGSYIKVIPIGIDTVTSTGGFPN